MKLPHVHILFEAIPSLDLSKEREQPEISQFAPIKGRISGTSRIGFTGEISHSSGVVAMQSSASAHKHR